MRIKNKRQQIAAPPGPAEYASSEKAYSIRRKRQNKKLAAPPMGRTIGGFRKTSNQIQLFLASLFISQQLSRHFQWPFTKAFLSAFQPYAAAKQ